MKVDENYIRESILEPQAEIVKGFPPVMPTFQGQLNDKDIDAIIAFINRSRVWWRKKEAASPNRLPSSGARQRQTVKPFTHPRDVSVVIPLMALKSVGPTFKGLYGSKVIVTNGQVMTADSIYISTCILEPEKNRVKGFQPVMPSFQGKFERSRSRGHHQLYKIFVGCFGSGRQSGRK